MVQTAPEMNAGNMKKVVLIVGKNTIPTYLQEANSLGKQSKGGEDLTRIKTYYNASKIKTIR